jgi:hypothetical protein
LCPIADRAGNSPEGFNGQEALPTPSLAFAVVENDRGGLGQTRDAYFPGSSNGLVHNQDLQRNPLHSPRM